MIQPPVPFFVTACLCVSTGVAAASGPLTLHANEASAQLLPRDQGSQQVRLQSLEFSLVASFVCPSEFKVDSLTASIADTHKRYGQDEIAGKTVLDVSFTVPADQIAPLVVVNFCVDGAGPRENDLLVPGVATAQVSLRCRSDSQSSVHYSSVALPLRLHCAADENQEASRDR